MRDTKIDNMKYLRRKIIIPIVLIITFTYLLISYNYLSIKIYKIETPLLKEHSKINIVLISDLHSTLYGKDQSKLVEKIKNIRPDLIILSGDIFDDVVPMNGSKLLLSAISTIAPVYYVTGNHEYWSRNVLEIKEILMGFGVEILSDKYMKIEVNGNEIILAGIEDPDKSIYENPYYNQDDNMEKAFRELDAMSLYKILIAHRPERIEIYKKYSFDLVLSGHTHGGQIRVPFIGNGLYAPDQGFFPKYSGGIYHHEYLTHIISRGLSKKYLIPRIFNPLEIVNVIIESEK